MIFWKSYGVLAQFTIAEVFRLSGHSSAEQASCLLEICLCLLLLLSLSFLRSRADGVVDRVDAKCLVARASLDLASESGNGSFILLYLPLLGRLNFEESLEALLELASPTCGVVSRVREVGYTSRSPIKAWYLMNEFGRCRLITSTSRFSVMVIALCWSWALLTCFAHILPLECVSILDTESGQPEILLVLHVEQDECLKEESSQPPGKERGARNNSERNQDPMKL